ncbi:FAM72 protein [Rhizoctonia solani]|uniref:FAM72 protein n=1 Tax=Rhizoctonia solani TaxID=456999 RepID=A0A8H7M6Q9_9AGAM|nr:FAM72 protein [Rhizoctonia solani]
MIRLRTGPNHDPYAAQAEYGPYFEDEETHRHFSVQVHHRHVVSGSRAVDGYTHGHRDGVSIGDWIRPPVSDDGVAAQLTGRIEMLRERIGAVERSREQDQRAAGPNPLLKPPPHTRGSDGPTLLKIVPDFGRKKSARVGVSASRFILTPDPLECSPPVALPPSETDVPPARGMKARSAVLLLRPNIALFSTDAMPVNCSPQPIAGQQPVYEDFERHPQDITDLLQQTNIVSPAEPQEEVLYARYFLPPKSMAMDVHPEKNAPERSADITSTQSSPAQPLPRTCECLTQTLSCHGCGAGIGYMIVTPCARCTAQQSISGRPGQPQRTANGHRFVFHHAEIVARERLYIPGQPGVHRYPWGIPPTASSQPNATMGQQSDSRSRVPSVDSEPKSPSIPVFQPHRDGNFIPIVSQVPARPLTRRIQNSGLKAGDVVFWHHLSRTGELGGVSLDDEYYSQHFVER